MTSFADAASPTPVVVASAASPAAEDDAPIARSTVGRSRWPSWPAVVVLVVGLTVTAALAWTSSSIYDDNEDRLLDLRVRELALVLSGVVPSIQTPLASAAELAEATDGDADRFRAFMGRYVGAGREFTSASLWPLTGGDTEPTVVVGDAPALASTSGRSDRFLDRAARSSLLSVTGILGGGSPRLGYGFRSPGANGGYAVYAESPLPPNRRSTLESASAFADLDYILYLGTAPLEQNLLVTNADQRPLRGRRASTTVPFGDSALTVVVSPRESLGGAFSMNLPWMIVGVGVPLTLGAALLTDRLARRRQHAERLALVLDRIATDNSKLYTEQRSIAQELQHAMLPQALPEVAGLVACARYVPATSGIDVGGDWYDIVPLDAGRALLLIGDVSGHGLHAATTMASLRHVALAYAAENPRPRTVLRKLSSFASAGSPDYFATALCALIDVAGHELTVATAGHPPPLMIAGAGSEFLQLEVGAPIGARNDTRYDEATFAVPELATLIAFTDGLVERRGELLDVGLARLRERATDQQLELDDLVAALADELASEGHDDDTAILGIRWTT